MLKSRGNAALMIGLLAAACSAPFEEAPEDPEATAENRVTFYTTYGYLDGDQWTIPMRIWVHEEPDAARNLLGRQARDELFKRSELESLSSDQEERYLDRAHGFIADSESNEEVLVRFDNDPAHKTYPILGDDGEAGTDRNGLIEGELTLTGDRASELLTAQGSIDGWLSFRAVSEDHGGSGRLRLISPIGVSVISDIDDTIKVTNIPAGGAEVIRRTFFLEFEAAPCMAPMYREFGDDVAFHYVSGSPWQLYQPLSDFLFAEGTAFPAGSFHMKNVRTNLSEQETFADIGRLVDGSKQATFDQKVSQISALLSHFPGRTFVLIGDSGEKDPEVFTTIRQQSPAQVTEIRIRDVLGNDSQSPERLQDMTIISPNPNPDQGCADFLREAEGTDHGHD